ncbi:MAG TPA: thermonuclease family protein [Candidatus Nanoarchaeia archaeon]|nr:thermonuclease family protein [Candidatus Nanoarchaeia archaeon]
MKKAVLLLLLVSCAYDPNGLRYVVDGDTFVLNNGEVVRLLGIDTPEMGDANYDRASYELQRLLQGRNLSFEPDVTDRDIYGRLLRYIYAEDVFVNLRLVEDGWARATYYPPDLRYVELFRKAQKEAQDASKGIWNVDETQYKRFGARCVEFGCPKGAIAVASDEGDVFYGCYCSSVNKIKKENLRCFTKIQTAIELGLRETRLC